MNLIRNKKTEIYLSRRILKCKKEGSAISYLLDMMKKTVKLKRSMEILKAMICGLIIKNL